MTDEQWTVKDYLLSTLGAVMFWGAVVLQNLHND